MWVTRYRLLRSYYAPSMVKDIICVYRTIQQQYYLHWTLISMFIIILPHVRVEVNYVLNNNETTRSTRVSVLNISITSCIDMTTIKITHIGRYHKPTTMVC